MQKAAHEEHDLRQAPLAEYISVRLKNSVGKNSSTALLANFTSSEQHGTLRCRSSCARTPRPPFRVDMFQSWDAPRLVQRSAVCPRNRLVFRWTNLEWFDSQ